MQLGYIRINPEENAEETVEKFRAGKNFYRLYWDKISIKEKDRPEYDKMMDYLREGDEIVVPEFARFNKTLIELVKTIEQLNEKNVQFISEKEEFNSGTEEGKLKFGVMQSIAEFEKTVIKQRQKEGIAIAMASGKYKGYNEKEIPDDFADFKKLYLTKSMSVSAIAEHYGVSKPTIYKWVKQTKDEPDESEEKSSLKESEETEVLNDLPVSNYDSSTYEEPEWRIEKKSTEGGTESKKEELVKLTEFEMALEEGMARKALESKPKTKKRNGNPNPTKRTTKLPDDFEAYRKMYHDGILSVSDIAIANRVTSQTIRRWLVIADAEFAEKEKRRLERKARRDAKKKALSDNK
ncbi:MAG: recombinase family protein [Selenomonadaceae bacterium]|nr:recombinase family protein [Selenomonadaceae bacterium]